MTGVLSGDAEGCEVEGWYGRKVRHNGVGNWLNLVMAFRRVVEADEVSGDVQKAESTPTSPMADAISSSVYVAVLCPHGGLKYRCRDLVRHPYLPRPMAAEVTDEDDEEAHAFSHHTHPPGYGGRLLEGAPCLGFSC